MDRGYDCKQPEAISSLGKEKELEAISNHFIEEIDPIHMLRMRQDGYS
jgi:hypothetical protein